MLRSYFKRWPIFLFTFILLGQFQQTNAQAYNFITAPAGYNPTYSDGFPISYNNKLYYSFQNYSDGKCKLGELNGNSVTLYTVPDGGSLQINQGYGATVFDNKLYFFSQNQNGNYQLAVFDGTAITFISMPSDNDQVYGKPVIYNNDLYVQFEDDDNYQNRLAKVDGNSLTLIDNISSDDRGLTHDYSNLVVYNGALYFNYNPSSSGKNQLAMYDGSSINLVADNPDEGDGFTGGLFMYNSNLYDVYTDESNTARIAKVNESSFDVIDNPEDGSSCNIGNGWDPVVYNSKLYFGYTNGSHFRHLASFDGTSISVIDNPFVETQTYTGFSGNMILYNNKIFFIYYHAGASSPYYYLVSYDGTATTALTTIPNVGTGPTSKPVIYDNKLYFPYYASSSITKMAVYTSGNSYSLLDNITGSDMGPSLLSVFNNKLYFVYRYPDYTTSLGYLSTPTTWTGASSSSWDDAGNWSSGSVPTSADDITIPSGTPNSPVVSSSDLVKSITINSGATLTVNSTLSVSGDISNNGSLNADAGTITLDGSTAQTIAGGNGSIGTLTVNNSAGASLSSKLNITTSLNFGTASNATFSSNGYLVIRSTINGTASVGQITNGNHISGDVSVERYISNNAGSRAWRMLAVPTQSSQSINNAWQEGQSGGTNNIPGYGTIITSGIDNSWASHGFDFEQTSGSLYTYNQSANSWDAVSSTLGPIGASSAYSMYIRGDRTVVPSSSTTSATATTLRTKGTLKEGEQDITIPAGKYTLIGNPYASAIDFTAFTKGAGIDNSFIVWDPKLLLGGSLGHYQTFSASTIPAYIPVPGGGSYTDATNTRIESGLAFFMHATTTDNVAINESSKVDGSNLVFRPSGVISASGQLITKLYSNAVDQNNFDDQHIVSFNDAYSNAVDMNDVIKFANTTENWGSMESDKTLWVEARSSVATSDTIFYSMTNMKQQQYQVQLLPSNLNTGLTAMWQDTYKGTSTAIDLSKATTESFTIDADPASSASTRFRIVFNNIASPVPVTFTNIKAYQNNTAVQVEWNVANETSIKQYVVEHAADGKNFTDEGVLTATNNSNYSWPDAAPFAGDNFYRIKSVGLNGELKYTAIVKITMGPARSSVTVYPNPVIDGKVGLQFTNQPAGKYSIQLIDMTGKEILKTTINHKGGSATQALSITSAAAKGAYQLKVIAPDNKIYTQQLLLK